MALGPRTHLAHGAARHLGAVDVDDAHFHAQAGTAGRAQLAGLAALGRMEGGLSVAMGDSSVMP
jgi:hypothetical protein